MLFNVNTPRSYDVNNRNYFISCEYQFFFLLTANLLSCGNIVQGHLLYKNKNQTKRRQKQHKL